jgi:hypothetical protein
MLDMNDLEALRSCIGALHGPSAEATEAYRLCNAIESAASKITWTKELPQKEGDYLWIAMWGCNCCINCNGIVTIHDITDGGYDITKARFRYQTKDGKTMAFFGDIPQLEDGKYPCVDGWMEITNFPTSQPATKGGVVTYKDGAQWMTN